MHSFRCAVVIGVLLVTGLVGLALGNYLGLAVAWLLSPP